MQRCSYRVHKVLAPTDGTTHTRTHGTTAALLYPHRNALHRDKKPERKSRSESRDIDENDIVQWLGEKFSIFCRLKRPNDAE